MRAASLLFLVFALTACREGPQDTGHAVDADGDGVAASEDCNDADATAYPDAPELCDGVDNDCDGEIDEDATDGRTFYADADDDGHGDPDAPVIACDAPEGTVTSDDDCDDDAPDVFPGATEVCNGVDDDCDGETDEGDAAPVTWYADADDDGHGDPETALEACEAPDETWVSTAGDCDDTSDAFHPGAPESCDDPNDYNCDGSVGYADADNDGVAACDDCDDDAADVYPGAPELCDGIDNDCDDETDEGVTTTFYADADRDGWGTLETLEACAAPDDTWATRPGDCDDTVATTNPGADEVCNGVDDDCDDETDEGVKTTFYADTDGDTYGNPTASTDACEAPDDYVLDNTDCDDTVAATNPGATEVCNGIDDDCDGETDEGDAAPTTFYADTDGDTWGDDDASTTACEAPDDTWVSRPGDCDDTDEHVYDGAPERCNGVDDDCDGTVPANEADDDEDGFRVCDDDCDDTLAAVNPDAVETCNGRDDDCDGLDDAFPAGHPNAPSWYADTDGDGYGDAAWDDDVIPCEDPGEAWVANDDDCDDTDDTILPGAEDVCDGVDNDCDGTVDDDATALGEAAECAATSCLEILELNDEPLDGPYWLASSGGPFEAWCDMTTDGGGWTHVGTVKNTGTRNWGSLNAFTQDTSLGGLDAPTDDFKSPAWAAVPATDYLVRTDEYAFGFHDLLGDRSLADMIAEEWPNACNTTFLKSGADYVEDLNANQQKLMSFILQPWDNNASCFGKGGNENAVIGHMVTDAWTPGLGNCPNCQGSWETHDLSLMKQSRVSPIACSGGYPCNANGFKQNADSNCYDSSCNVQWAQVFVR